MINRIIAGERKPDTELVAQCLEGDRDAFGQIVSRYQALICSLTYSATGSLGQSQDLAQETFITAWRHLGLLREREKLRAWLCGIARCLIGKALRRDGREPVHAAEPLDTTHEAVSVEQMPSERAITKEEEAILWRSIEKVPEIYREPLVLFYRENQSIERVAAELELSEDAVKQRLSRGRKLLAAEVAAFVEGALERTNPGRTFTVAVLAALPATLSTSAKAATLGAVAIKGGAIAKSAVAFGFLNVVLSGLLGFIGPWMQYRVFLKLAKTENERQGIHTFYRRLLGLMVGYAVILIGLIVFGKGLVRTHPLFYSCILIGLTVAYAATAARFGFQANKMFSKFRKDREEREGSHSSAPACEYRTAFELFGLPLVHIRIDRTGSKLPPVKAWIAAGDRAFGALFAFGGVAVAPFSIGGVAIGLMPWGGAAIGLLAVGGFSLGAWAFGGLAVGWQAFGGCALAWNSAMGGLAIARDFAIGGTAHAAQFNNEISTRFVRENFFFSNMVVLSRHIGWLNMLWLLPVFGWWRALLKNSRIDQKTSGHTL
jgi:RNA polymerase sigma factor (sigma-70 family)